MGKFVGYLIDGADEGIPVATGETREDAMGKTAQRTLAVGGDLGFSFLMTSAIAVREIEMTEDEYASLTAIVDGWAAKHCGIAA